MVQEGIECAILAGKIAVKGFSGDLQPVTQIRDRDFLKPVVFHHYQQTLFQFPLALHGLLCFAKLIHPVSLSFFIQYTMFSNLRKNYCEKCLKSPGRKFLPGVTKVSFCTWFTIRSCFIIHGIIDMGMTHQ
jgi:hypothetical protein